jgi:1-acyl-sn-glycerol-3-phosphate acyltransferase
MKILSKLVLKLAGWKLDFDIPEGVERSVLVSAPHTSNWDFVIGRLAMFAFGVNVKTLIKKELFFFPLGIILKAVGGIPVDRKNKKSTMIQQITQKFKEQEQLTVAFTPEGTRSYNPNWKKGFYHLAVQANVPVFLGYIDYPSKTVGIKKRFDCTGDFDKDIAEIKAFYRNYKGRFPEKGVR